ncbi:alpha/beta fold hydrolase [Geomonas sp.]|uniref:bifunctional alpha/beta hydrolase/OsmC family protein n=1 Tax=Geomonas sp. TaxID=2651584 RepID=UPI002B49B0CD|nr:alpha/beta fold hydrolase [Geomonas sp.]HJV36368.1 alpha/beta fold hydrolase [Geomonas sp.]
MSTTRITFPNARGEMLAARLELPDHDTPLAFALFAHCFTCSKDFKAPVHISRALSGRRIATLRFDFTGLGESQGDFPSTSFSTNVSDLVAAARYLEKEHQAPSLLVGHSLGGAAVLAAAAQIPTTKAVATIAAPFRPSHIQEYLGDALREIERNGEGQVTIGDRSFLVRKTLLDDLDAQEPAEILGGLKAALLVLHSPADVIVAIGNAADIYRSAPHPKSFISLDSADHLLSDNRDSRYAGEVIAAWANRYLAPAEEAPEPEEVADKGISARTAIAAFRTDLSVKGFRLLADEPIGYGGGSEGPSPYDYLLAALGACTSMTITMYARQKGWPLEEALVHLSHRKVHAQDCVDCAEKNSKIDLIERGVELKGELDEAQRQRLLEIAERCPVHRTLSEGVVRIETTLRPEEGYGKNEGVM